MGEHSFNQIILSLHRNYAALQRPPLQPTSCFYIYCFYYSLRGAHEMSHWCHKSFCDVCSCCTDLFLKM